MHLFNSGGGKSKLLAGQSALRFSSHASSVKTFPYIFNAVYKKYHLGKLDARRRWYLAGIDRVGRRVAAIYLRAHQVCFITHQNASDVLLYDFLRFVDRVKFNSWQLASRDLTLILSIQWRTFKKEVSLVTSYIMTIASARRKYCRVMLRYRS